MKEKEGEREVRKIEGGREYGVRERGTETKCVGRKGEVRIRGAKRKEKINRWRRGGRVACLFLEITKRKGE